ncbi:hypothetical protein HanRHA438_Chr08g0337121 [Helianthus annuus]|nr:hypothetical protein HanRHA438_Chr08g0337121 [Helianthus annuus]
MKEPHPSQPPQDALLLPMKESLSLRHSLRNHSLRKREDGLLGERMRGGKE